MLKKICLLVCLLLTLVSCGGHDTASGPEGTVVTLSPDLPYRAVSIERTEKYDVSQISLMGFDPGTLQLDYQSNVIDMHSKDMVAQCNSHNLYVIDRVGGGSVSKFVWNQNQISTRPLWQLSTLQKEGDVSFPNPSQVIDLPFGNPSLLLRYQSRYAWLLDERATLSNQVRLGTIDFNKNNRQGVMSPRDVDGVPEVSGGAVNAERSELYLVHSHITNTHSSHWEFLERATLEVFDLSRNLALLKQVPLVVRNVTSAPIVKENSLYVAGVDNMIDDRARDSGLLKINLDNYEQVNLLPGRKIAKFVIVGEFVIFVEIKNMSYQPPKVYSLVDQSITPLDIFLEASQIETITAGPGQTLWVGVSTPKPAWVVYQINERHPSIFRNVATFNTNLIPSSLEFCH